MHASRLRVLVTGGAGFIGSHLVDKLVEKGMDVRVIDNLCTGHFSNIGHLIKKIDFYEADIRDRAFVKKIAQGCDIIYHQAAEVSVSRSVENPIDSAMVNDIGTLHVLEAARKNSVKKVILASSCAVYGNALTLPKKEDMTPLPQSPYAIQKRVAEMNAKLYGELYGLDTVCLRYFNVFGPRQDPSSPYSGVISIFMTRAIAGDPPMIYGDGTQSRDFIFVDDVVQANLFALGKSVASGEVINIGTGNSIDINHLWKTIAGLCNLKLDPEFGPPRSGDIHESRADISKAQQMLGFEPEYSFEEGLKKTFKWYKDRERG